MAVGANFLNHPTALKNAAQITAETCDVTIKFGTGGKPYIHYKQPGGCKQINGHNFAAALFFCPQQLTQGEIEELKESWSTRTDHQVDSEDQELAQQSAHPGQQVRPRDQQQLPQDHDREQPSCQDSILGKTGLEDEMVMSNEVLLYGKPTGYEYSQTTPQTAPQTAPETAPQTVAQSEEPKQLESEERGEIENLKPTSEGLKLLQAQQPPINGLKTTSASPGCRSTSAGR